MQHVGHLVALGHVVGVTVGAQAHGQALFHHLQNRGAAHGVAHVAFGVMYHHGVGGLQQVHLGLVDVDAVTADGLVAQDVHIMQAEHQALVVFGQAVVQIVDALGHVDVVAGALGLLGCAVLQGLVAQGEGSMHTHHALDHVGGVGLGVFDEVHVLFYGSLHLVLAVAVADLVAQVGTNAELLGALGDGEQAALDAAVAGMVVKDGGHAVHDAVQISGIGAGLGVRQEQVAVDGPPLLVQNLQEVGGVVALDGQAAGKSRIDVVVSVDEAGHDHAALGVDEFGFGVLRLQCGGLAHFFNQVALNGNTAVLQIGVCVVASDQAAISQKIHNHSSPFLLMRCYSATNEKRL